MNKWFHKLSDDLQIGYVSHSQLSGGDIGNNYLLKTDQNRLFVKTYPFDQAEEMLKQEVISLKSITNTKTIKTPVIIKQSSIDGIHFLVLEWIETAIPQADIWKLFAEQLSALHAYAHENAGWDSDNFIGSLIQINVKRADWASFYIESRLLAQFRKAYDKRLFDQKDQVNFDQFLKKITPLLEDKISLLHGDLWNGNFICSATQAPVLIDPACYYGHALMDIAMAELFGGFSPDFFSYYSELNMLQSNWRELIKIYQCYPLLVHTNMFGGSYAGSVRKLLNQYK